MLLLDLALIGLAIAFDPLPLTAFTVVLPSKRGVRKGAAFVFGWLVSLAIVVTVTVLGTGDNPPEPNTPSLAQLAVKIAIGAGLVAIAIRHRRRMGQPKPPKKPPKWQAHVDTMSPWFAMGLAPALQPWGLIGAGAATVVGAKLASWESFLALFGFCVLASSSYLVMEIYAGFRPDQSQAFLARFRTWMDTRTDQVIIVGSLILGFWLIGSSICFIVNWGLPDRSMQLCILSIASMDPDRRPLPGDTWCGPGCAGATPRPRRHGRYRSHAFRQVYCPSGGSGRRGDRPGLAVAAVVARSCRTTCRRPAPRRPRSRGARAETAASEVPLLPDLVRTHRLSQPTLGRSRCGRSNYRWARR